MKTPSIVSKVNRKAESCVAACALLIVLTAASPVAAQDNSLLTKLSTHWNTSKEFTIAVAKQMPDADYSFKPNPEQMSFGEQMAHIATSNAYFFSLFTGGKSPISKPANFDKGTVIKLLGDSFDYCAKALPTLTPEQLHKVYDTPDGKMNGIEVILFAMDHTAHHRGQTEVYLRVKNIKPTDYRF
jgi:uncharacterized damage-inducible protein DinB